MPNLVWFPCSRQKTNPAYDTCHKRFRQEKRMYECNCAFIHQVTKNKLLSQPQCGSPRILPEHQMFARKSSKMPSLAALCSEGIAAHLQHLSIWDSLPSESRPVTAPKNRRSVDALYRRTTAWSRDGKTQREQQDSATKEPKTNATHQQLFNAKTIIQPWWEPGIQVWNPHTAPTCSLACEGLQVLLDV